MSKDPFTGRSRWYEVRTKHVGIFCRKAVSLKGHIRVLLCLAITRFYVSQRDDVPLIVQKSHSIYQGRLSRMGLPALK